MYSDHPLRPAAYLRNAKDTAHAAAKCKVNSKTHNAYRHMVINFIRARAVLRMEKADR